MNRYRKNFDGTAMRRQKRPIVHTDARRVMTVIFVLAVLRIVVTPAEPASSESPAQPSSAGRNQTGSTGTTKPQPEQNPTGFPRVPADSLPQHKRTNQPGPSDRTPIEASLYPARTPATPITRQLWRDRIRTVTADANDPTRSELEHLISLIRSVRLELQQPQQQPSEPPLVPDETPSTPPEVNEPQPTPESDLQPDLPKADPQCSELSEQTLQLLKEKLQDPNGIDDPLELAEILFHSGYLEQAAACYQRALEGMDPNDPNTAEDKPWALFQIGNCLRRTQPDKAIESYTQLIEEFPSSPWAPSARILATLTSWYREHNVVELVGTAWMQPGRRTASAQTQSTMESSKP